MMKCAVVGMVALLAGCAAAVDGERSEASETASEAAELDLVEKSTWLLSQGAVVTLRVKNSKGFALDGNNGAANGQSAYLWNYDGDNVNQNWEVIKVPNRNRFMLRKKNTEHCLDVPHDTIENGADVYLWKCNINNENQWWEFWTGVSLERGFWGHFWRKTVDGTIYAMDANKPPRADGVNVHMWTFDENNTNQAWHMTFMSVDL